MSGDSDGDFSDVSSKGHTTTLKENIFGGCKGPKFQGDKICFCKLVVTGTFLAQNVQKNPTTIAP